MRKRKPENMGFPSRWCWRHNAIYYQVPPGIEDQWDGKKLFRLGDTPREAYAEWSKRLGSTQRIATIGDLLQRYYLEISSKKPPQSLKSDTRSYKPLMLAFHAVRIGDIEPQDIYQYIDSRSAKIAARREISMLSSAYTKAVKWGYIKLHPFKKEVEFEPEQARDRYIEDWEIDEVMTLKSRRKKGDLVPMFQAFIKLNLIIGVRKANMLQIKVTSFTDEGIPVELVKKRKKTLVIFKWTDALREAVEACKIARPVHISPWLFCTRRGESYFNVEKGEASGFDSAWDRFMNRAIAETGLKERFTMHDLRGKAGSDAPTEERANEVLTHDSMAITKKHYRRKAARIIPLK